MSARLAAALALLLVAGAARAESLVSTLSDDGIEITSSFTGERIVVFGAVRGAPEGDPDYGVAVVVEGPSQDLVARRKGRTLGIWVNRKWRTFADVPSFYVAHFSDNLSRGASASQLAQYRLGIANLPLVTEAGPDITTIEFADAVVDLKTARGFYVERPSAVQFLAPGVFRTTFFLPASIPVGDYRVSVYLFRGETFLAGETQTLTIAKSGFSDQIARYANDYPLLYGLVTVALALFTGWLAGIIFRRG